MNFREVGNEINWRKILIKLGLKVSRSSILSNLNLITGIEKNEKDIKSIHDKNLEKLLRHCYENVPYYKEVLEDAEVIVDNEVRLDNFEQIPILTKEDIRENYDRLKSNDMSKRNTHVNSSGGSTGEPLNFIQDKNYKEWNYANKLYFGKLAGKDIGETEIKLWGSQRDIQKGRNNLSDVLRNFLYNRTLLNSFKMSEEDMRQYINKLNELRPVYIWSYVDSIYELANFIKREEIDVHSPKSIVVTAGTLEKEVRKLVEKVFETNIVNQYGSREVGAMASECLENMGLHVFEHTHHIEVVNENEETVVGQHGDIIVTNLVNYSMPLLRYRIEDTGTMSKRKCSCGRKFKLLKEVTGRKTNHFKNKNGEIIHGEYFTQIFYGKKWIRKFKVIQIEIDLVEVRLEVVQEIPDNQLEEIKEKIKAVMGKNCNIKFQIEEELEPSDSGKFLFTESKLRD